MYEAKRNKAMGNIFEDIGDAITGIFGSLGNFINIILEGIKNVFCEIAKLIAKIDWQKLAHVFLVELNPLHLIYQGLSTCPITEHMFRELDKFTGGFFTSVHQLSILPGRALRGDAISKEELISNALFVIKVALVVVAGGTAASIIAASSDQLKGGYLGETETGRAILMIATAGALAYAAGESILAATRNSAVGIAQGEGEKQLIEKTPLGESEVGRFLAGAGVRGTGAVATGGSATSAVTAYTEQTGKNIAKREVAQEIGGPYADQIANVVVEQGYPPGAALSSGSSGTDSGGLLSNVWEEIKKSPENVVNAIKNINISIANGESTGSKIDLDPDVAGVPRSGTGDPFFELPELNIEANLPDSIDGWEMLLCKIDFLVGTKKLCATKRKKVRVGGKWLWIYILEDGTVYWTFEEIFIDRTAEYITWFMVAAAALLVINEA